jgi:hypothetical protein
VLMAFSFHLVTSFTEATLGTASAMAAIAAAIQPNRVCGSAATADIDQLLRATSTEPHVGKHQSAARIIG